MNLQLYRFGFYIGKKNISGDISGVLSDWNIFEIGEYHIRTQKELEFVYHHENGSFCSLLGIVYDPFSKNNSSECIAKELLKLWLQNEDAFYHYFDNLAGNFVLCILHEGSLLVWPDALGTKPIFYDKITDEVVSHPQILADAHGYETSSAYQELGQTTWFRESIDRFMPGLITPFENILQLTPNTMLISPGSKIQRFFPRFPVHTYRPENLVGEVSDIFLKQMDLLCENYPIAISATAGYDSRLTIASSKFHKDDIYYYTIPYNKNGVEDTKFAAKMMKHLGAKHHTLPFQENAPQEFLDIFQKNVSNMSSPFRGQIAYTLYQHYPGDHIHLKSNGSEVCRSSYRRRYKNLSEEIDPKQFSKFMHSGFEAFAPYYEEMIAATDLTTNRMLDYDIYDLAYWEVRIGKWQSLCLMEWEIAQRTILPYNCRRLLCMMLNVPLEERISGDYYKRLMEHMWKETLTLPINKHMTDQKKKQERQKKLKKNVIYRGINKVIRIVRKYI